MPRIARRLSVVFAAVAMVGCLFSSAAFAQDGAPPRPADLTALGTASPVGKARIYHVRPGHRIHIRVAGLGTITGARKTVTRRGLLRVQRYIGQLDGVTESAAQILNKQVRSGRPVRVSGLAEATGGPAFSACAGLLTYALRAQGHGVQPQTQHGGESEHSRFSRLGMWLRENF